MRNLMKLLNLLCIVYVIFKAQFDFALEMCFSRDGLLIKLSIADITLYRHFVFFKVAILEPSKI